MRSTQRAISFYIAFIVALLTTCVAFHASANADLSKQAQQLKKELVEISSALDRYESELLYPAEVKVAVFLSLANQTRFKLDSIELYIDDELVSSHLYQNDEITALRAGGKQQLFQGSVQPGSHKLTASFNGQGRTGGYFKRKKALSFDKKASARYIELVVNESPTTGEPIFKVKQW